MPIYVSHDIVWEMLQLLKMKNISLLLIVACLAGLAAVSSPSVVSAATITCPDGKTYTVPDGVARGEGICGSASAPTTSPTDNDIKTKKDDCQSTDVNKDNCGIVKYLVLFIRVLSGIVGITVAISIAVGGIQYSMAGGDPSAVANARKRIMNAIIALLAFIFTFAFLNWLVPGGVL